MRQPIYPRKLYDSRTYYSQGIRATGSSVIYCSGQASTDVNGNVIGKDLRSQCHQCLLNIRTLLESAKCCPQDVVRLNIFVVHHRVQYLAIIGEELASFFAGHPLPSSTLIGVETLAQPEFLIEIEATAVVGA